MIFHFIRSYYFEIEGSAVRSLSLMLLWIFDVIILIILYKWFYDSLSMIQFQCTTKSKLYWEISIKFNIVNNFQSLKCEYIQLENIWKFFDFVKNTIKKIKINKSYQRIYLFEENQHIFMNVFKTWIWFIFNIIENIKFIDKIF
jgi:hypothetical protein